MEEDMVPGESPKNPIVFLSPWIYFHSIIIRSRRRRRSIIVGRRTCTARNRSEDQLVNIQHTLPITFINYKLRIVLYD